MADGWEQKMVDGDGRLLVRPLSFDRLRRHPIWAVYQFERGSGVATARNSDFVDLDTAKLQADSLNARRAKPDCYFRVLRLELSD
jgi:hypothetical protein